MEEIKTIEMSELDYRLILHIKGLRESRGLSQIELSHRMGLSSGFIGKVELLTAPDKYSIRHLKLLADIFKVKNFSDLFPSKMPAHDMIRLTLKISNDLKKDGTPSKKKITEVIKIEAIVKNSNK
jgi:transcriptional regulator with XRE-family HTH domain